jgi:hypothetical protein
LDKWKSKAAKLASDRFEKYPCVSLKAIDHYGKVGGSGTRAHFLRPMSPGQKQYRSLLSTSSIMDLHLEDFNTRVGKRVSLTFKATLTQYLDKCKVLGINPLSAVMDACESDELVLDNLQLKYQDLEAIEEFLNHNITIGKIDLSNNQFGPSAAPLFLKILKNRPLKPYTSMNFARNKLGDKCIEEMAYRLAKYPQLTEIMLQDNGIEDKGAEQVAEVIAQNTTLTYVNVSNNKIGENGGFGFGNALRAKSAKMVVKLNYLNIAWNTIRDMGASEICKGGIEATSLHTVIMSFNGITNASGKAIASFIESSASLTHLDIGFNKLGAEAANLITAALSKTKKLQNLYMGFNPIGFAGTLKAVQNLSNANTCVQTVGIENCSLDGPNCDGQMQNIFNAVYLSNKPRKMKEKIKVAIEFPPQHREFIPDPEVVVVPKAPPQPLPMLFEGRALECDGRSLVNTREIKVEALKCDLAQTSVNQLMERLGYGDKSNMIQFEECLLDHYSLLIDVFRNYVVKNNNFQVNRIWMNTVTILMNDAGVPDSSFKISDIDRIYITTYSRIGTGEKCLSRAGFVELVIRVAIQKYHATGLEPTPAKALDKLVKIHFQGLGILPMDFIRNMDLLYSSFLNRIFQSLKPSLQQLYEFYSSPGALVGTKKIIHLNNFLNLCSDAGLALEFSKDVLAKIFLDSKMISIDEPPMRDKADMRRYSTDGLTFLDFLEAICRISLLKVSRRENIPDQEVDATTLHHECGITCINMIAALDDKDSRSKRVWSAVRKEFGKREARDKIRTMEITQQFHVNKLLGVALSQAIVHRMQMADIGTNPSRISSMSKVSLSDSDNEDSDA